MSVAAGSLQHFTAVGRDRDPTGVLRRPRSQRALEGTAAMHVDLRRTVISLLYRPLLWLLDRRWRATCYRPRRDSN